MVITVFKSYLEKLPSVRHAFRLAAVLLLAACVSPPPAPDAAYSDSYGKEVLGAGFTLISDRYIDPISMHDLAVSGISGLRSLDSQLQVDDRNNGARLSYADRPLGTINLPTSQSADAWSTVTVRAIAMARTASPAVAEADAEAIFKAVFDGIIEPLDGFSRYAGTQRATEHRALRDGFGGIGVSIRMEDDSALVLSVNDTGPAAEAKLQADDRMTHVEGEPVAGWTQRQLVDHLRGKIGTQVRFTIKRPDRPQPFDVTLTRAHIVPVTVTSRREDDVAIIRIGGFNRETARKVENALKAQLASSNKPLNGVILDLRSNPGGLLDQAVELADTFLDSGDIILTFGRHPRSLQRFVATVGDLANGLPLVILVNGNSASASEVVTAALQDQARAIVVGSNSFGKGTVQTVLQLPNRGEITLTWSRLVTPSGYRLHQLGILPSICTRADGEAVTPDRLLAEAKTETQVLKEQFSRWRATGDRDSSDRETLRRLCPSDSSSPDTDVAIAKNLLANPALYKELIAKGTINLARR
ncbi:MAG: PDZ domain-containing protein [Alphaproteobacteria bacterium]|nr:PDZ domain-containing protein [Alphaproteobacteria bacterium]